MYEWSHLRDTKFLLCHQYLNHGPRAKRSTPLERLHDEPNITDAGNQSDGDAADCIISIGWKGSSDGKRLSVVVMEIFSHFTQPFGSRLQWDTLHNGSLVIYMSAIKWICYLCFLLARKALLIIEAAIQFTTYFEWLYQLRVDTAVSHERAH